MEYLTGSVRSCGRTAPSQGVHDERIVVVVVATNATNDVVGVGSRMVYARSFVGYFFIFVCLFVNRFGMCGTLWPGMRNGTTLDWD